MPAGSRVAGRTVALRVAATRRMAGGRLHAVPGAGHRARPVGRRERVPGPRRRRRARAWSAGGDLQRGRARAVRGPRPVVRRDPGRGAPDARPEDDDRARPGARRTSRRCSSSTSPRRRSRTPRPRSCSRPSTRLRARGVAILYVSHRLEEVFRIAQRYTILRNGRTVAAGCGARTTSVPARDHGDGRAAHRRGVPAWTSAREPGPVRAARPRGSRGRRITDVTLRRARGRGGGHRRAGRSAAAASCCASSAARRGPRGGRRRASTAAATRRGEPGRGASGWASRSCPRSGAPRRSPRTRVERNLNATTIDRQARGAGRRLAAARAGPCAGALGPLRPPRPRARPGGADAVGRQPAEGGAGEVPGPRAAGAAARRADARRGRRHQEPDLPPDPGPGGGGLRGARGQLRAARDPGALRPDRGAPRGPRVRSVRARRRRRRRQLLHVCYGRSGDDRESRPR